MMHSGNLSRLCLGVIGSVAALTACGGGSTTNPIQGVSPGGIWRGTDSASGLAITGLVDEKGTADFIRSDNAQYVGQVSTSGNSMYATIAGYPEGGKSFPDGSNHGSGTIRGTIQERQSISATIRFTTDAGTSIEGPLDLTFDPLYNRPSSLAAVAGSFTIPGDSPIEIHADGSMIQIAAMCQQTGQITVIDPAYNVYQVQLSPTCHGVVQSTGSGLGTLDNTVSPEQLVLGVVGSYTGAALWPRCDPQTQIC